MDCGSVGLSLARTYLVCADYFRLTYIYINMSLRYKRWEKEQEEKMKSKKETKKQK